MQRLEIDLKRTSALQEIQLKRMYARGILWLLGTELVIANAVFVAFAWAGENWELETAVIDVWLAATVVQGRRHRPCGHAPPFPRPQRQVGRQALM
jgi:hypothetical protein